MLPARSQAGAQCPRVVQCLCGRGKHRTREGRGKTAVPSKNRLGRGRSTARRSLRWGWGSRGFVSSVGSEPMLNGIPLCQLSPTLQCCLRAWDMLFPGDKTQKNPRLPWKMQSHLFRGPRTHVLLLPEGSEAMRAGGVGVTSPLQTSSPALGAVAPQCPGGHQAPTGQTRDRKTGKARGFTRVILGLFPHLRRGRTE